MTHVRAAWLHSVHQEILGWRAAIDICLHHALKAIRLKNRLTATQISYFAPGMFCLLCHEHSDLKLQKKEDQKGTKHVKESFGMQEPWAFEAKD